MLGGYLAVNNGKLSVHYILPMHPTKFPNLSFSTPYASLWPQQILLMLLRSKRSKMIVQQIEAIEHGNGVRILQTQDYHLL